MNSFKPFLIWDYVLYFGSLALISVCLPSSRDPATNELRLFFKAFGLEKQTF